MYTRLGFTSVAWLTLTTSIACAATHAKLLGTSAPPHFLGGIEMASFPPDLRSEFQLVTDVPASPGRTIAFDTSLEHLIVPYSWASWSHGYEGDVYALPGSLVGSPDFSVTITLPANTSAFIVYAEPEDFGLRDFFASIAGGPTISSPVSGDGGAVGFAFYADPGEWLGPVTITSPAKFAIGEFSANSVPEGGSGLAGLGLASIAAGLLVRRYTAKSSVN